MTKPKPLSILAEAQAASATLDWLEKLPAEKRAEVHELLQAKIEGRVIIGREAIVDLLAKHGIITSESGIRRAISKIRRNKYETA